MWSFPRLAVELGAALFAAWGSFAVASGDEPCVEQMTATTAVKPNERRGMHADYVWVHIDTALGGQVVRITARHGERFAELPAHDWKRALDNHLARVRVEFGRTQPRVFLLLEQVPPEVRMGFLDIVKRRVAFTQRSGKRATASRCRRTFEPCIYSPGEPAA